MPNPKYTSGRRWEYEVMKRLQEDGWIVMRTSGSHGPFDVIALKLNSLPLLIQCKRSRDEASIRRMAKEFQENPPLPATMKFRQKFMGKVYRGPEVEVEV